MEPTVYVRPGATGVGTMADPVGDLGAAIAATSRPAVIALARGTHTLSAPLTLDRDVELVGADASATVIAASAMSSLIVEAASTPVTVTLSTLTIRGASGASAGVAVRGAMATLRMREVAVTGVANGVVARAGATLCADHVSVGGTTGFGVYAEGASHLYLHRVLVRGAGSTGIYAGRSHLVLRQSRVDGSAHDGVAVVGGIAAGACGADSDCETAPACAGFLADVTHTRRCRMPLLAGVQRGRCVSAHVLQDSAALGNRGVAFRAQRASPGAMEDAAAVYAVPGPLVTASRIVAAATAPLSGGAGGDGLYVGPGAMFHLDLADAESAARAGRLSRFVQNARVGVLVDGEPSTSPVPNVYRAAALAEIVGAQVASNRGPGVYVQQRALVPRVLHARFVDNTAVGLAVTTEARVSFLQDDQFTATREGTVAYAGGATSERFGDGLSVAAFGATFVSWLQDDQFAARLQDDQFAMRLQDDQFTSNERAGVVAAGTSVRVRFEGASSAVMSNSFGVSRLDGATAVDVGTSFQRAVLPAGSPYVRAAAPTSAGAP